MKKAEGKPIKRTEGKPTKRAVGDPLKRTAGKPKKRARAGQSGGTAFFCSAPCVAGRLEKLGVPPFLQEMPQNMTRGRNWSCA